MYRDNHILGHKTKQNKFKITEIIQCLFSDHNKIKPEISKEDFQQNSQTPGK